MEKPTIIKRYFQIDIPDVNTFIDFCKVEDELPIKETLLGKLQDLGCSDIEYNGHFGSAVYLSLSDEDDTPENWAKIEKIFDEHMELCLSVIPSLPTVSDKVKGFISHIDWDGKPVGTTHAIHYGSNPGALCGNTVVEKMVSELRTRPHHETNLCGSCRRLMAAA